MLTENFRTITRPNYELTSAAGWSFATLWAGGLSIGFNMGLGATTALCTVCGSMAVYRGYFGKRIVEKKLLLSGTDVEVFPAKNLLNAMPKIGANLWLGRGWRWTPEHTAIAYEMRKRTPEEIYPPKWWLKLAKAKKDPYTSRGLPWIHGMNTEEEDVLVPIEAFKGHCAIIATTGAIKTRLAALIITQLIAKGDVVIVIDPKGDKELREIMRQACAHVGKPEKFLMLHPSFASQSVRLDLLKNWERSSQVASRLGLVLGSSNDDTFAQFCWSAIHRINCGMKYVGERASILSLKRCMESRVNVEILAKRMLEKYFKEVRPDLLNRVNEERNKAAASAGKNNRGQLQTSFPELTGMVNVFNIDVTDKDDDIQGVVTILNSSQEWFGKMITSILPLLTKLTTDDLKGLLSPDYDDIDDPRPIMDSKRVVEGGHALYVGTDALADPSIGKATAAMLIAETASVAAEIYNHGIEDRLIPEGASKPPVRRIHLFIDEWGDAMCEPLVQQANKGRGADVMVWAMGQTIADLEVAFGGDKAQAKRFMGNMNNLIIGAVQDPDTQKVISEQLSTTSIKIMNQSKAFGGRSDDGGMEYAANMGFSTSETEVPLVSPDILRNMEDLHFIASVNRTQTWKGRIPVVLM